MADMVTKRRDPNYAQITGHIPKELSLRFRVICTAKEIDISEGLEESIAQWVDQNEVSSLPKKTTSDLPKSLQQLVLRSFSTLVEQSGIDLDRLKTFRDGEGEPTEIEILRIALALGFSEKLVAGLPLKNGGKQPNGVA